jgi:spore coat polysaccharide biosynthesis protein SpsF
MIVAILQARMSSSRLPGKVLLDVLGKPMIVRQIERILHSSRIDKLILATSTNKDDDSLCEVVSKIDSVVIFRGNLENVLDRFYQSVREIKPDSVVRLTGDCPLADPMIIDDVIDLHLKELNDYTTNTLPPSYPDGMDIEIFTFEALRQSWENAILPSELEHVTSFIRKNPSRFKIGNLQSAIDYSDIRLTVDESEDYKLILEIYRNFSDTNIFFLGEIIEFLKSNIFLLNINSMHERNTGSKSSREKDKQYYLK